MSHRRSVYPKVAGVLLVVNACVLFCLWLFLLFISLVALTIYIDPPPSPVFSLIGTFLFLPLFLVNLKGGVSLWKRKYSSLAVLGIAFTVVPCLMLIMALRGGFVLGGFLVAPCLAAVFMALSKDELVNKKDTPNGKVL